MTLKQMKQESRKKQIPFVYNTKHYGARVYFPGTTDGHTDKTFDQHDPYTAMFAPKDIKEALAAYYAMSMLGCVVLGSTEEGFCRFN